MRAKLSRKNAVQFATSECFYPSTEQVYPSNISQQLNAGRSQ